MGQLVTTIDGGAEEVLSPESVDVTNLVFNFYNPTNSEAVKINLSLTSEDGVIDIVRDFSTLIVLRNSY